MDSSKQSELIVKLNDAWERLGQIADVDLPDLLDLPLSREELNALHSVLWGMTSLIQRMSMEVLSARLRIAS